MTSELIIQNLLSSVTRSLRLVFKNWLSIDELERRSEEQIILYLEKTEDEALRKRVIASLKPSSRAILKNVIENPDLNIGEILAVTRSAGHNVNLSSVGDLHYKGLAFFERSELWPSVKSVWTDEHSQQILVFPPAMQNDVIEDPPPEIHCDISFDTAKAQTESVSVTNVLLAEFLDSISRAEIKLTQHGSLSSRSRKALGKIWDTHNYTMCTPEHMINFARGTGIVRIDSTGTTVIERRFANFRKKTRAQQMKEFLNFSIEAVEDDKTEDTIYPFQLRKFSLRMICTILSTIDKDSWLRAKPLSELVSNNARKLFSEDTGVRGWFWPEVQLHLPPESVWKSLCNDNLNNWLFPAGVFEWGKGPRNIKCLRLTPLGRFWLQDEFAPAHEDSDQQLVVQPDFTAVITHSGPWDRVAQQIGIFARKSGNDNATVFHFSKDSINTAVQQGHKIQDLLSCLNKNCTYPVPKNVKHSLKEWGSVSPNVTLYRDINLFSFESEEIRNDFISKHEKAKPIGSLHVLLLIPENDIFNIMTRIYAKPVDYTDVPIGSIEVKPDGKVVSHAPDDLRLIALRDSIADPVSVQPNEVQYYLSSKALRTTLFPANNYDRLVNLPGRPISINVRLNILVGFGILERMPDNQYAVLSNFAFSKRNMIRKYFDWKNIILARVTRDAFAMSPEHADTARQALKSSKIDGKVTIVTMEELPIINTD